MARPQSPDHPERRRALIDAAAACFSRSGFAATSMSDLAKASGTAKSLVYHYFSSKQDVLYEVVAEHLGELVAAARAATASGPPEAQLRALTTAFVRLYASAADRHRVLLNELGGLAPDQRAAVVARQREIVATVEALVRKLRPDEPEPTAAAMLYFGMINWTHTWYRPDGRIGPEALADKAAGLFLRGLLED